MSKIKTELDAPRDELAEQAVLGAIMLDEKALTKVSDWLEPEDFFFLKHALLYRAIIEIAGKSKPYDAVTVAEWIAGEKAAEGRLDPSYVIDLANRTPSAANVVAYAEIVKEKSKLRELIAVGMEMSSTAYKGGKTSAEIIATEASRKIANVSISNSRGGPVSLKKITGALFREMSRLYDIGDAVIGMRSPWPNLDALTSGFQDGELYVVAGRPNMGKSIVGLNIAEHASVGELIRGAVFSVEMTGTGCTRRLMSSMTGIPFKWMRAPTPTPGDDEFWPQIIPALGRLADSPMILDEESGLTAAQICARARREHMKTPLRYIVVDHLHLIALPGRENESVEIGHATRLFKQLAKDLNCPVILLAQLNRGVTGRGDKRPTMADLRASGAIEQDADVILFVHREDYYEKTTHLLGVVEIIIGKGRDVEAGGVAYLENEFTYMRLRQWDGPLPQPKRETAGRGHTKMSDHASEAAGAY